MERDGHFPLRRSRASWLFLRPLAWGPIEAEVGEMGVSVRMGWIGSAQIPFGKIDRIGRMDWPWWGGLGVRLSRGLVAFVASSGPMALIELSEPIKVRAPLRWTTSRVAIGVDDVEGFIKAVAQGRDRYSTG